MTKRDLLNKYNELCNMKHMRIGGIGVNSSKMVLEDAIGCLEYPDETLDDYLVMIKMVYPNTYRAIQKAGDFKQHTFNRFYVYIEARRIIEDAE